AGVQTNRMARLTAKVLLRARRRGLVASGFAGEVERGGEALQRAACPLSARRAPASCRCGSGDATCRRAACFRPASARGSPPPRNRSRTTAPPPPAPPRRDRREAAPALRARHGA